MKRTILIFLFLIPLNHILAQREDCASIVQKDFLDKIQDHQPTDLIPYNVVNDSWQEKWGLMHRETKEKLTAPIMDHPSTFNPDISFFFNECDVKINKRYALQVEDLMVLESAYDDLKDPIIQVLDSINGYRGFKVDGNGNLTAYSKAYYTYNWHHLNISKPFFYEGEYYAIVKNSTGDKVIINTRGELKKGFTYKDLRYTEYKHRGENIFYAEDQSGKKGFITLSGRKYHFGKLLKHPFYSNELFGYTIQHDGIRGTSTHLDSISKSGILDLSTMKWLIKPKKGLKIIDMVYTSEKSITKDHTNRDNANIYFVVLDDKLRYLIDEDGNTYIPE